MTSHKATAAPLVAAVVLNWNGLDDSVECVQSLLAQTYVPLEIHIVDNASAAAEADRLAVFFGDQIVLHRNAENLGFAGGCNVALRRILADGRAEFAVLLNNDAVAEPGWIAALVAAASADPSLGSCAGLMVHYDAPGRVENAGVTLLTTGDAVPRGRGRAAAQFGAAGDVLAACAGGALYRVDMLRRIGLFREDYFANFEDVDLGLRAFVCGYGCGFVPAAVVRHRLSRSIAKVRDDAFHVRSLRNLACAYWTNAPWPSLLLALPFFLLRDAAVFAVLPLLGQGRVARLLWRARRRVWAERRDLRAARRDLRPLRRCSWWRFSLWQRPATPIYCRFLYEAVVRRRRSFLQ
ncbi:MAG: glycosyltransferase family 2 protein [Planctomycetota bacterium]